MVVAVMVGDVVCRVKFKWGMVGSGWVKAMVERDVVAISKIAVASKRIANRDGFE